jgi:hypothetical protein
MLLFNLAVAKFTTETRNVLPRQDLFTTEFTAEFTTETRNVPPRRDLAVGEVCSLPFAD